MAINMDLISLGTGYGTPAAPTPLSGERPEHQNAQKESRFAPAVEVSLSEEAQALLARMEQEKGLQRAVAFGDLTPGEQSEVRTLEAELADIFGPRVNKKLNAEEKAQAVNILQQVNELRGFDPKVINPIHNELARRLEEEADRLLNDPNRVLSEGEEKQLAQIFAHLESIQGVADVSYQIPDDIKAEVAALERQLDSLYGIDDIPRPGPEQMARAEEIFSDLRGIYDGALKRLMKAD